MLHPNRSRLQSIAGRCEVAGLLAGLLAGLTAGPAAHTAGHWRGQRVGRGQRRQRPSPHLGQAQSLQHGPLRSPCSRQPATERVNLSLPPLVAITQACKADERVWDSSYGSFGAAGASARAGRHRMLAAMRCQERSLKLDVLCYMYLMSLQKASDPDAAHLAPACFCLLPAILCRSMARQAKRVI